MKGPVFTLVLLGLAAGCASAGSPPLEPAGPGLAELVVQAPNFVLDDGDYLLPRVSPDGRRLAFAEVTVVERDEFRLESTRLWVLDLETRERTLLLDEESAVEYGWYAASALRLTWAERNTLILTIHDGDVGTTDLTFDAHADTLVSSEHDPGDLMSPEANEMVRRMAEAFPESAEDAWHWLLGPSPALRGDQVMFSVQERFDHPPGTWAADLDRVEMTQLLSHGDSIRFTGGVILGADTYLFTTRSGDDLDFLLHESGQLGRIYSMDTKGEGGWVEPLVTLDEGVLMRRVQTRRFDEGDNPLFWYDGEEIQRLGVEAPTIDADVWVGEGTDRVLVLNAWHDGKRRIDVRFQGSQSPRREASARRWVPNAEASRLPARRRTVGGS